MDRENLCYSGTEASGIGKGVQKSSGKRRGSGNKGGEEGSWRGGSRWVASASEEWRSWESFSSILMSDFNIFLYVCCFFFIFLASWALSGNLWETYGTYRKLAHHWKVLKNWTTTENMEICKITQITGKVFKIMRHMPDHWSVWKNGCIWKIQKSLDNVASYGNIWHMYSMEKFGKYGKTNSFKHIDKIRNRWNIWVFLAFLYFQLFSRSFPTFSYQSLAS